MSFSGEYYGHKVKNDIMALSLAINLIRLFGSVKTNVFRNNSLFSIESYKFLAVWGHHCDNCLLKV